MQIFHMKERLLEEWHHFDQRIIDRAVSQWRQRLHLLWGRRTLWTSNL